MDNMPDALDEWAFRFILHGTSGKSVSYKETEDLLLQIITPWAEAHDYGIGGGFDPNAEDRWRFEFGLCQTESDELIPREKAEELLGAIKSWAKERGYRVRGGFRPFTDEEKTWDIE